jgi:hypothetical protein
MEAVAGERSQKNLLAILSTITIGQSCALWWTMSYIMCTTIDDMQAAWYWRGAMEGTHSLPSLTLLRI